MTTRSYLIEICNCFSFNFFAILKICLEVIFFNGSIQRANLPRGVQSLARVGIYWAQTFSTPILLIFCVFFAALIIVMKYWQIKIQKYENERLLRRPESTNVINVGVICLIFIHWIPVRMCSPIYLSIYEIHDKYDTYDIYDSGCLLLVSFCRRVPSEFLR